ncbi:MAG: hypothetical protein DYG94_06175 [Leptolyngbya sp. PLA3]|nr:MAG: hypothetical protein EDM82_03395 [Cyanobacteria bacterium CYA]MCE7968316.1 hypothetical protein [Leptolyngbya sp. PL-A3]
MSDECERHDNRPGADERPARLTPGNGQGYDLAPPTEPDAPPQTPSSLEPGREPVTPAAIPAPQAGAASDRPTPFVEGFGGIRFTTILFSVLLLATLVIVGVRAGSLGFQQVLIHLASAVLQVAAYGSLGALASIAAARCVGTRVAEPELFAMRMLAATAAYRLLLATGTPIPTRIDDHILGMVGYVTTVWLLFRLNSRETGLVAIWHLGLAGLLALTMTVSSLVVEPKPSRTDPGTGEIAPPHTPPDPAP